MATESKLVANTSNGTCQTLVAYVRQEINTLQSKSGSEFDTAYIDEMVHGHQKGLRLINDALIPNARNAELKVQLQSLKTQVELQLRRAEDAQRTLSWQNAAAPSLNTSNARP